jgi:hypothetical protein
MKAMSPNPCFSDSPLQLIGVGFNTATTTAKMKALPAQFLYQ